MPFTPPSFDDARFNEIFELLTTDVSKLKFVEIKRAHSELRAALDEKVSYQFLIALENKVMHIAGDYMTQFNFFSSKLRQQLHRLLVDEYSIAGFYNGLIKVLTEGNKKEKVVAIAELLTLESMLCADMPHARHMLDLINSADIYAHGQASLTFDYATQHLLLSKSMSTIEEMDEGLASPVSHHMVKITLAEYMDDMLNPEKNLLIEEKQVLFELVQQKHLARLKDYNFTESVINGTDFYYVPNEMGETRSSSERNVFRARQ